MNIAKMNERSHSRRRRPRRPQPLPRCVRQVRRNRHARTRWRRRWRYRANVEFISAHFRRRQRRVRFDTADDITECVYDIVTEAAALKEVRTLYLLLPAVQEGR